MSQPVQSLVNAFCTDEDIAARFKADFPLLCDREWMAQGTDGTFVAGTPWALTSASNTFDLQGVARGNVILLKTSSNMPFGSAGMMFAVDSALGSTVNLRRINQGALLGMPPVGPGGLAGVTFAVPTLAGQIELATYDIEKRFGISDFIYGRRQNDLWDAREVRDVTVLTVAYKRFLDLARQGESNDVYFSKYKTVKQELDDMLARVAIHWADVPLPMAETNRFSTRISR